MLSFLDLYKLMRGDSVALVSLELAKEIFKGYLHLWKFLLFKSLYCHV